MPWTKACNWNESNLNPFSRNNWRASLVPAAAVIPAPIVYIKVVAVKKLVVGFQSSFKRISGLLCQFVTQCVLVFLLFFLVILTTRSSLPRVLSCFCDSIWGGGDLACMFDCQEVLTRRSLVLFIESESFPRTVLFFGMMQWGSFVGSSQCLLLRAQQCVIGCDGGAVSRTLVLLPWIN